MQPAKRPDKLFIILLSPAHPLRGGIAASTERLAVALQEAGHRVVIYSFSLQYPGFLFPGKTQYTEDPPPDQLEIRTCINSVNPFNWIKIGLEIKRQRPDVIVSRYWLPFMAPSIGTICKVARRRHTTILSIADNIIPHEKRPGDQSLTHYYIANTDGFVVMSQSVEADIRLFDAQKPVRYVPHPVYDNYGAAMSKNLAQRYLNLSPDFKYILFFGFIREYKGLDLLLQAMADERIKKIPVKLLVAGEYYGNQEYYEEIIRVLDLEPRLILKTEYIPTEEVRFYFSAADLVVQPYKTATQSGISQLAYHFEKPMVVTRVGGLPEIVPHGKVGYVTEVNPKSIADAIVDFFGSHDADTRFASGIAEEKKKYSWDHLVKGIESLHEQIRTVKAI